MKTAVRRAPTALPPAPLARRSRLRAVLLALATGLSTSGLLWLGYFPVAWGWLVWFALVPWLLLVRAELPRGTRYPIAWLAGTDAPASSALTQERLGWRPVQPGLMADLERAHNLEI